MSEPGVRRSLGANALVLLVLLYRATLGHFMGGHCRYVPSCSQYAIDALTKYGAIRGGWRRQARLPVSSLGGTGL